MAPRARGIVIPVFSGDGAEGLRCSQLDLARAIGAALESGAAIINISGGQLMPECEPDADLRGALAACEARRVLVVAAAGNDGCDRGQVPACVPGVLAVAAAGVDGRPLATSNWGEAHRRHGVLAPGENIIGAVPGGGTAEKTGTSFAAPIVSGIAAAMLMREIAAGRDADPLKLRGALAGKRVTRDGRIVPLAASAAIHQTGKAGRTDMSMQDADQAEGFAAVLEQEQARGFAPPAATGAWPPAVTAAEHTARPASADAVEAACAGKACGCGGAGDCGCGCGGARKAAIDAPPALVYALGQIGFDYASEARRDSIAQFMRGRSPSDEKAVLAYLSTGGGAEDIERMIWTIRLDSTPIYAIQPVGAFAAGGYARILQAYRLQLEKDVPLVAVPGRIAGSVRLMSGETVPVIVPAARGILSWDVADAVESFIDEFAKSISRDATEEEGAAHERETQAMRDKLPGLLADSGT
jgi:cyanobactin maturation PatA/PatG family protease